MTTIACNKTEMACDLQATADNSKIKVDSKITMVEGLAAQTLFRCDKALIGFAGATKGWGDFIGWLTDPTQKMPKIKNLTLLALTDKGQIFHGENGSHWMHIPQKFLAIGSGAQFAVGALEAGKSPKDAVKAAMKNDVYTGMGVRSFKI